MREVLIWLAVLVLCLLCIVPIAAVVECSRITGTWREIAVCLLGTGVGVIGITTAIPTIDRWGMRSFQAYRM